LKVGNSPVNVHYDEEMPDFMRLITSLPIGKEVPIVALRAGKEFKCRVAPVERGEVNPKETELKQWGLTVRNISFITAREMKRTNQNGVLVSSVRPGGPAGEAKPQLNNRDVITEVNGKPVNDFAAMQAVSREVTQGRKEPTPVLVTFERESRRFLTVVRVGLQEMEDPGLEVSKAWVPVETQVITREIAQQVGQPDLKGFYVTQVYPHSTAEKAGLKPGDFILAVDNEKLTASAPEHQEEFAALIRQYDIGAKVELTILREKERQKLSVELARSPKVKREMKKYRNNDFEFTARDISFFDAAEEQWAPGQRGVLVEDVKPGSWAELGSLYVDDLIVEIDGQPTADVGALKQIMENIAREKKTFVVIRVLRGIHTIFLELEPAWKQ
jgi:serine protease Do